MTLLIKIETNLAGDVLRSAELDELHRRIDTPAPKERWMKFVNDNRAVLRGSDIDDVETLAAIRVWYQRWSCT